MSVKVILRSIKFTFGAKRRRLWHTPLSHLESNGVWVPGLYRRWAFFDECENKNLRRRRPLRAENF